MLLPHDLPPEVKERIARYRLDALLEKHERFSWRWLLDGARFVEVDGLRLLLPFTGDASPRIAMRRRLGDPQGDLLTMFLRFEPSDTGDSAASSVGMADEEETMLVVCVRIPEQDFFITTINHAIFPLDDLPPAPQ